LGKKKGGERLLGIGRRRKTETGPNIWLRPSRNRGKKEGRILRALASKKKTPRCGGGGKREKGKREEAITRNSYLLAMTNREKSHWQSRVEREVRKRPLFLSQEGKKVGTGSYGKNGALNDK